MDGNAERTSEPVTEPVLIGLASFPPVLATNPYQRLLYEHLSRFGIRLVPSGRFRLGWLVSRRRDVRILHFHWIQPYYASGSARPQVRAVLGAARLVAFALRLATARALGYRVVWTIHQVLPHESNGPRLDRVAALVLSRLAHVLVAHDRATADSARRLLALPADAVAVVPHGSYVGVYPAGRDRAEVREALGIAPHAFVFLAFGLVRRYKDIDLLLEAFSALPDQNAVLVVAGMPLDEHAALAVMDAAADDDRVRPLLEFVPDSDVAGLFDASDVAVVARSDGGTSGALVLALSLGVPVVAAATPAYAELVRRAGWLFEPGESDALRGALAAASGDPVAARALREAARAQAESLTWADVAARLAELMLGGRVGAETTSPGNPSLSPSS